MRIYKLIGCLLLLCAVIASSVILTVQNVAADAPLSGEEAPPSSEGAPTPSAPSKDGEAGGTVEVTPSFSEGLLFLSNGDGTCSVAGVGSCTASCIRVPPISPKGDVVTGILPFALVGSSVSAIELPSGIREVSAASFAGCERLSYLRVASGSEWLLSYDGVLYTANGQQLLYCPVGRSEGELVLHPAVRRICAGAVASCPALDTVVYQGSISAWHSVIVGDSNEAIFEADFRFAV
jgi:hypothetical protein